MTSPTRVCTECRTRKPLTREFFYARGQGRVGFRHECRQCSKAADKKRRRRFAPPVRTVKLMLCHFCGAETPRLSPTQRSCGKSECRAAVKREANERQQSKKVRHICACGRPCYFTFCEKCRVSRQQEIEADFLKVDDESPRCGCGEPLEFSSDPMTGRTLETCARCGTRPVPIIGTRYYDQRETLSDALDDFIARASKPPDGRFRSYGSGRHFRQRSHEFTRKSA